MLNIKKIFFSTVLSSLCLFKNGASAMESFSFDKMPVEMRSAIIKCLGGTMYEDARKGLNMGRSLIEGGEYLRKRKGIHGLGGAFSGMVGTLTLIGTAITFTEQRHSFFNLRLVSHIWKEAVEDTMKRQEVLQITLSPENANDEFIARMAPLATTLTLTGWQLENCSQIDSLLSNNNLENILSINIPTNVIFNLCEILKNCPKIRSLSLEGRIFTTSTGASFAYGNSYMCLPLLASIEYHPKNLKHLSLCNNNLKDDIMGYILLLSANGYFKKLERLDLGCNKISPTGLQIFYHIKAEQLPCIEVIKLGFNPLLKSHNLASEKTIEHIVSTFPMIIAVDATACSLNEKQLREFNRTFGRKKIVLSEADFSTLLLDKELGHLPAIEYDSDDSDDSESSSDDEGCVIQ